MKGSPQLRLATLVAFVSGFVALGYEILWARRLADIIGATALASSLVVGVFFLVMCPSVGFRFRPARR